MRPIREHDDFDGWNMRILLVAAAAVALTAAGCSSDKDESSSSDASCPAPMKIENSAVAAALETTDLPADVAIVGARASDVPEEGVTVAVDVCAPSLDNADALRPTATQIAKTLKSSAVGPDITTVWVENYVQRDGELETLAELKDPAFKMHLWNGKASPDVELQQWEVLTG